MKQIVVNRYWSSWENVQDNNVQVWTISDEEYQKLDANVNLDIEDIEEVIKKESLTDFDPITGRATLEKFIGEREVA